MSAPRVYKSTDTGAPVLNGLSGSLVGVLTACLVTGYNGGVSPAAGWTTAFTGQDIGWNNNPTWRIFQGGSGLMKAYCRIQDDAPNTNFAGGREARMWGVEPGISGYADNSLAAKFPTAVQAASGIIIRKSATYDTTARPWVVVADDRTFYLFILSGDYTGYGGCCFGEIFSFKNADNYNCIAIGGITEQIAATPNKFNNYENLHLFSTLLVITAGHFMPRSWTESYSSAVNVGKHGQAGHSAVELVGLFPYPNPVDGGLYLFPVTVHEIAAATGTMCVLRGRMRGFWHFLHPASVPINDGDTWSGTGALAGKTFMAIKPTPSAAGLFVVETSNTWETN